MKSNLQSVVTFACVFLCMLVYLNAGAQDANHAGEERYLGDEKMRLVYLEAFRKGVLDVANGSTLTIRAPNTVSRQAQTDKTRTERAEIEGYYDGIMAVLGFVDKLNPEWRARREEMQKRVKEWSKSEAKPK